MWLFGCNLFAPNSKKSASLPTIRTGYFYQIGILDLRVFCNPKHKFRFILSLRILWKRNVNKSLHQILDTDKCDILYTCVLRLEAFSLNVTGTLVDLFVMHKTTQE
jgi:hypothetical protein